MLDVTDAQSLIFESQPRAIPVEVSLTESRGLTLSRDVQAPTALPVFDNSAMDGYAVRHEDTLSASVQQPVSLKMIDEIWAGKISNISVTPGSAVRIMTGAKIPHGADAVVMKEKVRVEAGLIMIDQPVSQSDHIRFSGEEIKKGDIILSAGIKMTPSRLGLLASVGINRVGVYPHPRVIIIPTGSELVSPGASLGQSQIYESNSYALRAALENMGIVPDVYPIVVDDHHALCTAINHALTRATHVILCGGVSVGDHDHSRSAFAECGIKEVFWGVKQKPGKPLYFGMHDNTVVFGLPGNPASSLVCFYEYVRPSLLKYQNEHREVRSSTEASLPTEHGYGLRASQAYLVGTVHKRAGYTYFLRAQTYMSHPHAEAKAGSLQRYVKPIAMQGSHMMKGFSEANCLLVLDAQCETAHEGRVVDVHLLPQEDSP